MSNIEMTVTARTYREIQAEIKELEAQADALKQTMIREMDARQVEKLNAGEYTISYTLYESGRLDSAKLKADHADLYAAYTKRTTSTRFQVA
jgi:predicted phage-related endonuclease